MVAGIKASFWLSFACIFFHVHGSKAQESGLSAVTETQQEITGYYDTVVKNWVHSGRPGLFMSNDFDHTENSTFQIKKGGVYYVSANLIIETKNGPYYYYSYYSRATFQGEIHLSSDHGYVDYNKHLYAYVTMRKYEQKNLRISGYIQLDEGWKVSVELGYNYRWRKIIKAGSTLSLMYVSNPSMFPGVLLKSDYEYLYLESPSYSANVVDWNEIDEGSVFPTSEGDIMIPHDGLYHVLVNLNIRRYSEITIDFGIMINNKTEAISKRTKIDSQGRNTIILEGILNLEAKQIISIKISNPNFYSTYIRVGSSSTFFIFSKGMINPSTPALSTHYKSSSTKLPANRFSELSNWNTTSPQSLDHYKTVELKQGEFVAPKSGIYQVNIALYLSNCTTAAARILVNKSSEAISPDIGLMKESNDCYLENSLILKLATNDKLRLQVKSDVKYTVLSKTSYQVVFQTKYSLWPAAIFKLKTPFKFNTNSAPVKVHDWSHHMEGNWNDLFFKVNKEKIMIPLPGLYLLSYNVIVKTTASGAQFFSEIIVNGSKAVEGSTCQRGRAPPKSTCTTSTIINLNEKTNLALHVRMKASSKKQSVEILNTTRLTVISLGNTRSHPAFKLNLKAPNTEYNVKASSSDKMQSLAEYSFPNTSFFQSGPIYSNKNKTFHGGQNISFLLLNNVKFDLQNDGYLASVVGSENSNMMVYSNDHKTSQFSLSASDVTLDSQFYFNVSATAKTTAFQWQPEDGSVASGVYIDHKETIIYLKAQLKPKTKSYCSSQWTQIAIRDWNLLAHLNNLGKISTTGVILSTSGFYLTSLNLAVTANTSNIVIDVAIFADKEILLSASETSPADGKFSVFLQGIVEAVSGQHIEVKVKCTKSTEFTFATGGGISVVKIDEQKSSPGMRKQFSEQYIHGDNIGHFNPRYSYRDDTFEVFRQGINNDGWKLSVARNGVYLISVVGYAHTDSYSTGGNFELGFLTQANISENSACSLDSSPLFFKDSSNRVDESLALTGFVSLNKHEVAGFLGRYDYYAVSYSSRFYMSLQFVGDIETSYSFMANLKQETPLLKGQDQPFKGWWVSDKTCGQFGTRDIRSEIQKYSVLYTGYYMVAINLVLDHKDGSDFRFCFTVNGKAITAGVKNVGCFTRHLKTENHTSISTVSNSELLYLEEGNDLSVQWSTSLAITISKNSSFSVFYLGTAGAILGSSWVIQKAELTELPTFSYRYHYHYYYRYHYYDDDRDYAQHIVKGWKASLPNTKMFFQNGVKTLVKDMFVSPQDGVYVVFAKLHVKGNHGTNETCGVKLQLAVDGEVLDFAFKDDITGTRNTLSFTTTLRLEKWQGVTVRVSWGRSQCKNMAVEPGSSFAVVYLDSGKKAFTLWPNIGPHIVEFPAERTVYVRQDKDKFKELTCKAVGEYPITYEWITNGDEVLTDSNILDTATLNASRSSVKCVATMRGLVAESNFVWIRAIDPTIIFVDTYSNRTYELPEKNDTTTDRYQDVLIFGAKEKKTGYYSWYWSRRINCSITGGDKNNTFMITYRNDYYYYWYYDVNQYFTLRARLVKLDHEKTSEYKINITCRNLDYDDAATATTTIDIKILDANDNLPVFEKEIYKAKIPKNINAGESILQVMATDDDSDENGKIKYSLIYSSDSYIFSIDETYGVISLKQHEVFSKPVYTLTAVATDQGKPPRKAYVTVILEVQGATVPTTNHTNTNPVFPQQRYIAYLIPGTPEGTEVTIVHAHDPFTFSHENIRYYLRNGDDSVFKVDSKTGKITTKGDVTDAQYLLEIAAEYVFKPGQKPGQYFNTTLVIVLLRKVDTSEPHFEKYVYQIDVSESTKIDSQIVEVKAVYKKPLVYTEIVNSTMFKLNRTTGEITLAGKLDYEKQKYHTLVIKANNPKEIGKVGRTTVIIHVTDYNDNTPVIYHYPRHGIRVDLRKIKDILPYKIGRVKARDKDSGRNSEIRYYLKQDYNAFSIDPENGTLYVKGHLDCCDMVYALRVEARDQGIPPRYVEVNISVSPFYSKNESSTSSPSKPSPSKPSPSKPSPSKSLPSKSPPKKSSALKSSSDQKKYIIAGAVGGVVLIIIIAGALYWRRRHQRRSYTAMSMNYMNLPSDEEDDDLLDAASDNEDSDNNARLSLISAASDDNLLRNEEPS